MSSIRRPCPLLQAWLVSTCAWALFWSPSPHTVSALLTGPWQSLIHLLTGIDLAPHAIAGHQGNTILGLSQHATAALSRPPAAFHTLESSLRSRGALYLPPSLMASPFSVFLLIASSTWLDFSQFPNIPDLAGLWACAHANHSAITSLPFLLLDAPSSATPPPTPGNLKWIFQCVKPHLLFMGFPLGTASSHAAHSPRDRHGDRCPVRERNS